MFFDNLSQENRNCKLSLVLAVLIKNTSKHFIYHYTVNSPIATTSHEQPPPVSDHFVNNCFVSLSNTASKTLL